VGPPGHLCKPSTGPDRAGPSDLSAATLHLARVSAGQCSRRSRTARKSGPGAGYLSICRYKAGPYTGSSTSENALPVCILYRRRTATGLIWPTSGPPCCATGLAIWATGRPSGLTSGRAESGPTSEADSDRPDLAPIPLRSEDRHRATGPTPNPQARRVGGRRRNERIRGPGRATGKPRRAGPIWAGPGHLGADRA